MRRIIARYALTKQSRADALAEVARLEGASLATNTLRHHIGNSLAVAVGYSELLADDPRLPADLQAQASKIQSSATTAADIMNQLASRLMRIQVDTSVAGPVFLDIEASTAPHQAPPAQLPDSSQ